MGEDLEAMAGHNEALGFIGDWMIFVEGGEY